MPKTYDRILTDREPFRLPDDSISEAGYLTISARIARIGIQAYYGHELSGAQDEIEIDRLYKVYRSEAEVFSDDALDSFRDLPITFGHPASEVDVDNYRSFAVGHVIGLPIRDGDFIRAELTIRDSETIAKIKAGESTQLSVGYHADVTLEQGTTPDGQAYDAVQRNIRGNHIALVGAARCGPQCSLEGRIGDQQVSDSVCDCDCASCQIHKNLSTKEHIMTDFVMINGEQIPLAEAVEQLRDANSRMAEALKDANATIEAMGAELETKNGEVEALKQAPTGDSDFTAKVQARAQMLSESASILGDSGPLSDLSDGDIRRRVINHIYGDGFASGASEHALIGMYKVAVRDAARSKDNLNGHVRPNSSTTSTHLQAQLQTGLTRRNERLANAWKGDA